jgi:cytochrome o ubiquinol oxidase subunit III
LMSDAIVFALLFATYAVMARSFAGGPDGRALFDIGRAFAETMLLLASSLTFGLATVSLMLRRKSAALLWLAATFALGAGFLVMEVLELSGMILAGAGPARSGFLSAFFALVGAHGLHVATGMLWILILSVDLVLNGCAPATLSRLRRLGLFWHFLDIVWIGICSVVYLPGML